MWVTVLRLAGGVEFVPRLAERVYLSAGTAIGGYNVGALGASTTRFAAEAFVGPRIFLVPHIALDIQYALLYSHIPGATFTESSGSTIATGFSFFF